MHKHSQDDCCFYKILSMLLLKAKRFQRRRLKCEKLTDDRRRMPSDGKSSHCRWQGELKTVLQIVTNKLNSTVHR